MNIPTWLLHRHMGQSRELYIHDWLVFFQTNRAAWVENLWRYIFILSTQHEGVFGGMIQLHFLESCQYFTLLLLQPKGGRPSDLSLKFLEQTLVSFNANYFSSAHAKVHFLQKKYELINEQNEWWLILIG